MLGISYYTQGCFHSFLGAMVFSPPLIFALIGASVLFLLGVLGAYVWSLRSRVHRTEQAATKAIFDKSRFISHVGHEIRNPLNAILGMSELLIQGNLPQEKREQTLVIRSAADTLLRVATNLLGFFGSADAPKQETAFNLPELIGNIKDALMSAAFEKRLRLDIQIEPESPSVVVTDAGYVRQIISNVLAHSIGLTEKGQVEVIVHAADASAASTTSMLRITVADTGPTLSPSMVTALFEPYGLQDRLPGGNPPGTGLNMHNAQAFAKLIGGSVSYRPHATGGGLYEIALPARVLSTITAQFDSTSLDTIVSINDPYVRHRAQFAKRHVLVIEDQRSNQQVLKKIFHNAGHLVVIAETADQALEQLENENFDAIVIDLRLPGTGGIDVMKLWRFKNAERNRRTPFIVLTGEPSEKSRQTCLAVGAAAYLAKPASAQRLLDTLITVCENTSPEAAAHASAMIDVGDIKSIAEANDYKVAPANLTEYLRDALRYVSEIETAGLAKDWDFVRVRARAIRGAAYSMGAINVIAVCRRIIELSDAGLRDNWPLIVNELEKSLDDASKTLSILFQKSLSTA